MFVHLFCFIYYVFYSFVKWRFKRVVIALERMFSGVFILVYFAPSSNPTYVTLFVYPFEVDKLPVACYFISVLKG